VSQEIESGSQIVNTVADHRAPFDWNVSRLTIAVNFTNFATVWLSHHIVGPGLFALKGVDRFSQLSKMLFGPINLYPV
jgi:hypothetical protein